MAPANPPRMLKGDEADIYAEHHRHLMNVLRARVLTTDESILEDASAHAWLQLLRCQPRRDTVFSWLCAVAIHEAWDLTKRRQAVVPVPDCYMPVERVTTDIALDARDALTELANLPDRQRRYLTLLIAGHSYRDITRTTGVTYTNVNKHLVRARRTIRQRRGPAC